MKPTTPGVKLTYDDFVLFPDDGLRHELIDGEHYVTPSPNIPHQRIVGNLYVLIRRYLDAHPLGEVFLAALDVILSQYDVVEPDLLYVSADRRAQILTKQNVRGRPDLVIEVGSPGTRKRDETIKRLYERSGVTEYWIVDPDLEVVRVYRQEGGAYGHAVDLSKDAGDVLATPLLPGLRLPLADIFRIPA